MRSVAAGVVLAALAGVSPASAQGVDRWTVDSAIGVSQYAGENASDRPDIIVDVTAAARLGKGWVAFVRPWFRKASSDPYALAKEIYQAAAQYERPGRISTRVELGYILSPIGLGMMDMRPDTNPVIMSHLSYFIPMPSFDPGAPSSQPIASSYPLGGQVTASTTKWDVRTAVVNAPPNRGFVLGSSDGNPRSRPVVVVGGGLTPLTGVRFGVGFATGRYNLASETTGLSPRDRDLRMLTLEGDVAFGYTRLTGELVHDWLDTAVSATTATEWFIQGQQTLTPRWFAAARYEGANAPPRPTTGLRPTLRMSEVAAGFRMSPGFTLRTSFATRKTYFNPSASRQVGVSLVWARRWR